MQSLYKLMLCHILAVFMAFYMVNHNPTNSHQPYIITCSFYIYSYGIYEGLIDIYYIMMVITTRHFFSDLSFRHYLNSNCAFWFDNVGIMLCRI